MEEKILTAIRKEYKTRQNIRKEYKDLTYRINELEQNEIVKEYLELLGVLENHEGKSLSNFSEEGFIESVFSQMLYKIKKTNEIYVYMGTYMLSNECDIVHGSSDLRLDRNDPEAQYRIYGDIEKSDSYFKRVPIDLCDEFEKKHRIIFPRTYFKERFFYAIQRKFFEIAINEGQEAACNQILSENNIKE